MKDDKRLILFGAGKNGRSALVQYRGKVAFFCDNSAEKQGTYIEGILVISFDEMLRLYHRGYMIMITPANNAFLIGQLELENIYDYLIFHDAKMRFFLKNEEHSEREKKEKNTLLRDLAESSTQVDLLKDISKLKEASAEALRLNREEKISLFREGYNNEGYYYGNVQALMDYAKIPKEELRYFPLVSHNDVMPLYHSAFLYKSAVIFSGTYFRKKIHERSPYVPVFSVGPFIHYAKGIYDPEKLQREKNKIGRMLLAFLPHTIEGVERYYSRKQFIDTIIDTYGNDFETIWLSVYWADVNDEVCEYAQDKGIHVVSAGFRFDTTFSKRLKTILELSDAVVCGDIGTFIAYALYMGKPIARVKISDDRTITEGQFRSEIERKLQLSEDYERYVQGFYRVFDKELKNTEVQRTWINAVSGLDQTKSPEYIRHIFEISKDIWKECNGNMEKYPQAVRRIYSKYNNTIDVEKMRILKAAAGTYVD